MTAPQTYDVARLIDRWEVPEKPSCANCRHCRVTGDSRNPEVYCYAGHGRVITLGSLLRGKNARSFRAAAACPDREDMGPACNLGHPAVVETEGVA